jgi:hypothetical protein
MMGNIVGRHLRYLRSAGLALVVVGLGCSKKDGDLTDPSSFMFQNLKRDSAVDIVLVVANSTPDPAYRTKIATEVRSLVGALNRVAYDWHLAITTTDMSSTGSGGDFLGTPSYLSPFVADSESLASNLILDLDKGSDFEKGIDSVATALNPIKLRLYNPDLIRPKASLVIIFVGNSVDLSTSDPENFAVTLDKLKTPGGSSDPAWIAHYYGALSKSDSCFSTTYQDWSSPMKYARLAELSGGFERSLCSDHLTDFFDNLAQ